MQSSGASFSAWASRDEIGSPGLWPNWPVQPARPLALGADMEREGPDEKLAGESSGRNVRIPAQVPGGKQ